MRKADEQPVYDIPNILGMDALGHKLLLATGQVDAGSVMRV